MSIDILAIGVHPDDVELACCGTLLHHIALGHSVAILDLTQGERGTRGTADTRKEEAAQAAQLMNVQHRYNAGMADCFFQYSEENILKIAQYIRLLRPKIVLANAISDRHPDHGRAGKLIADACFYAGLPKIETTWEGAPQAAHRPKNVYHYIQDHNLAPDFIFDISPYMQRKLDIILSYKTQFFNPDSQEPRTPISGQDFLLFVEAKARTYGRAAGFEYAEGFTKTRDIGINNLFNLV